MCEVLVSIVCITYNHKHFIRQCLDGFLMQQCDFPFEIIIHDDASNDGTSEIIKEYSVKYPDIFRVFFEDENQFLKTDFITNKLFSSVRGKYVALCEGDDFWTDPLKLKKQVELLELNKEAAICFHPIMTHWEDHKKKDALFPQAKVLANRRCFYLEDLLKSNFIPTCSVMYRWRFHADSLNLIPPNIFPMDWFWHLLHAQKGSIIYSTDCMAVYRKHAEGVWYEAGNSLEWLKKYSVAYENFIVAVEKQFGVDKSFDKKLFAVQRFACAIKEKDLQLQQQLKTAFPFLDSDLSYAHFRLFYERLMTHLSSREFRLLHWEKKQLLKQYLKTLR